MTIIFSVFVVLLVLLLAATTLSRASPAGMANAIRLAGPIVLALVGVVLLLAGRAGFGGMLLSGALAWYGSKRMRDKTTRSPEQRSRVRSAALEMELNHDTGGLDGVVLAGRHEGRRLAEMREEELLALRAELEGDPESLQLLETYLDSRFPAWRKNADTDQNRRQGSPPASGAMSKEEAYEILGLKAGASAADIRQAHRRLMQRLHPDMGGSVFLATRINEARDVLLAGHE